MMKIVPAPSPSRMYLTEPSPLSEFEWSCKGNQKEGVRIQMKGVFLLFIYSVEEEVSPAYDSAIA